MSRFLVQRKFPDGLAIPADDVGARQCRAVVDHNAEEAVTWLTSYVSLDRTMTFCVYDGPSQDAIRRASTANGLPVDRITEVRVLDPYFYGGRS